MLTYKIQKQKATLSKTDVVVADREQILARHCARCWLHIGDTVKFKKPKRNPIYGVIIDIQTEVKNVVWSQDNVPYNIVLEVAKEGKMPERVRTNAKKLVYVRSNK